MQNQIIKQDIFDNTTEVFIAINPTKQQIVFFPKEESQMFTSKTKDHTEGSIPNGLTSNSDTESENGDTLAFMQRVNSTGKDSTVNVLTGPLEIGKTYKIESFHGGDNFTSVASVVTGTINTTGCVFIATGTTPTTWTNGTALSTLTLESSNSVNLNEFGTPEPYPTDSEAYKYNLTRSFNSSHTPTDYIGATNITVPATISDSISEIKLINLKDNSVSDLYEATDATERIKFIAPGFQTLRIPDNKFNKILTTQEEVEENNNSELQKNFGQYYLSISPKFVQTIVGNIITRKHIEWLDMVNNGSPNISGANISITPEEKRRTIYQCDKDDFKGLVWDFEASGEQSGRLYGSVVEVWDSTNSTLKQTKIITENEFNFDTADSMRFVLYPDNVGYDTPDQEVISGDILKIFPRETYFNQILIEINYKDKSVQVENLLAFMLNDTVRDLLTGVYEVYDNKGFTIDDNGNFTGTVENKYQIFATDRVEARKRVK